MSTHANKRVISNFVALGIVQGTNFLLPIFVMPHVIKRIGADGFGVVAIAQVVMLYLSTIADYGFNLTATRSISVHRDDTLQVSRVFFTTLASKLFITLLCFILLLLLVLVVPIFRDNYLLYILGFTYVIGQSMLATWIFQGMEKMQYITVSTLIARVIFILLVIIFIRQREDKKLFLFFLGIGNMIAGILSIYLAMIIFKLKFVKPLWTDIIYELKSGWQITISNLSINTFQYVNIFILRLFTNDLIVGYYSVAERIFFAIRQILGLFSQAIYPRICQLAIQARAQLMLFLKQFYVPFLICVAGGCVITFVLTPQIVNVFLHKESELAILLLKILCFVPIIVCLNVPSYLLLLAYDQKRSYFSILTLGTVVNLLCNLVLVHFFSAVGTAISVVITETFITIGLNWELYKTRGINFLKPRIS